VREAQLLGEPAAWVTLATQSFLPEDAAAGGVDLDALPVVRVPQVADLARAADRLARSGAFGLIVLDMTGLDMTGLDMTGLQAGPPRAMVRMATLARLLGLAQKHAVAVLFLTHKPHGSPSLGSLVSLRAQTRHRRTGAEGADTFVCELRVIRDKRGRPGWTHEEICRGPAGLH
jgi:recombination protein RecA